MNDNRIVIQISSGQGPEECELAVAKLFDALCGEFHGIELIDKTSGGRSGCCKSIRFYGDEELRFLEGTVLWICRSPFRPKHKRKNWFVDVSVCADADEVVFDESLVRFDTFRSGGKGGQHVNKTESGVRAIYEPTGDSAIAMDERSQHRNKAIAAARLKQVVEDGNRLSRDNVKSESRLENYRIVRGNPVRVYMDPSFTLRRPHDYDNR